MYDAILDLRCLNECESNAIGLNRTGEADLRAVNYNQFYTRQGSRRLLESTDESPSSAIILEYGAGCPSIGSFTVCVQWLHQGVGRRRSSLVLEQGMDINIPSLCSLECTPKTPDENLCQVWMCSKHKILRDQSPWRYLMVKLPVPRFFSARFHMLLLSSTCSLWGALLLLTSFHYWWIWMSMLWGRRSRYEEWLCRLSSVLFCVGKKNPGYCTRLW